MSHLLGAEMRWIMSCSYVGVKMLKGLPLWFVKIVYEWVFVSKVMIPSMRIDMIMNFDIMFVLYYKIR